MIKVELIKESDTIHSLFFEATKIEETDTLEEILKLICKNYMKRGSFVLGAPSPTLKVDIKIETE
jgi:hypothetical protein